MINLKELGERIINSDMYKEADVYKQQQLKGSLSSIAGLIYHYDNFMRFHEEMHHDWEYTSGDILFYNLKFKQGHRNVASIRHEQVAYLSRIGQIYYFMESLKKPDFQKDFPTIFELMYFRHKYAAHRSLDKPKEESDSTSFHLDAEFSVVLSTTTGFDKEGYIQCTWGDGERDRSVDLRKQHPLVMAELDCFFNKLIPV